VLFDSAFASNIILVMLILPGCSALSAFRSQRLLSQLKEFIPQLLGFQRVIAISLMRQSRF
jgi:hypothetical protein